MRLNSVRGQHYSEPLIPMSEWATWRSGGYVYQAIAPVGTTDSAKGWMIWRLFTDTDGKVRRKWADGVATSTKILDKWNSYDYDY